MNNSISKLTEVFSNTVANYNRTTIDPQVIIFLLGLLLTSLLYKTPNKQTKIIMKLFLSFSFGWIAVAFFFMNGSKEFKRPVTGGLYAVISLAFFLDIFINKIKFIRNKKYDRWAKLLFVLYLAYPLVSYLLGRRFPVMTTWVMPCPLAVFTIALLISHSPEINYFILILLTIWGLIGLPKGFFIFEDFILGLAGLMALAVLIKERKRKKTVSTIHQNPSKLLFVYLSIFLVATVAAFILQFFAPDVAARYSSWNMSKGWQREIALWITGVDAAIIITLIKRNKQYAEILTLMTTALCLILGINHFAAAISAHGSNTVLHWLGTVEVLLLGTGVDLAALYKARFFTKLKLSKSQVEFSKPKQ